METFICPVCREKLEKGEKAYTCPSGHSFDIAAKGYVNLLMSQTSKLKRHGDDKLMVNARRDFLSKGFYEPLRSAVAKAVCADFPKGGTLLDAGCGECWYTSFFASELEKTGLSPNVLGVDISKNALAKASRDSKIERAVAGIFSLPVGDGACDAVVNIFAPLSESEFCRVLRPGGTLVRAVPLARHLWELKAAVYDNPYENDSENSEIEGFRLVSAQELRYSISLDSNTDIVNLFMMTPYYYKTSKHDFEKLKLIDKLDISVEFGVLTYKKK